MSARKRAGSSPGAPAAPTQYKKKARGTKKKNPEVLVKFVREVVAGSTCSAYSASLKKKARGTKKKKREVLVKFVRGVVAWSICRA